MPSPKKLKLRRDSQSSDDSQSCSLINLFPIAKTTPPKPLTLLDLPTEILQNIFNFLPFENVSKIRIVSRRFNEIGSSMLNSEFLRIRLMMQQRFQSIKAQMPRRESARRKHPLARESDIVETLHMRLTLLQMTFGKHVERKHCCFFAGEILDEVYKILTYIKATANLSRVYKVTDELFDLSTMAMEYFKEHIEPTLPEITYFATDIFDYTPSFSSSPKTQLYLMDEPTTSTSTCRSTTMSPTLPSTSSSTTSAASAPPVAAPPLAPAVRKRLRMLRESLKRNNGQVLTLKKELKLTQRRMTNQQKQIHELKARYEDYDKKFQNTSRKLNAVLQELSRCKTELQYWRSKSPAAHCTCGKMTPVAEMKDLLPDQPNVSSSFIFGDVNQQNNPYPTMQIGEEVFHVESDEFKPISVESMESALMMSSSVASPVLVVPACHSAAICHATPTIDCNSLASSGGFKNETFERKTVIEATFDGPNKPMTRASRRKLDMDHNEVPSPSKPRLSID